MVAPCWGLLLPILPGSGPLGSPLLFPCSGTFNYGRDSFKIAKPTGLGSRIVNPETTRFTIWDDNYRRFCIFPCSLQGQTVQKVGFTTGWTEGQVTGTCVNTDQGGTSIHFLCQTQANYASEFGDSGAPVFVTGGIFGNDPTQARLDGIHWGGFPGEKFFSEMLWVESELGPDYSKPCNGFRTTNPFSFYC